MELYIKDRNLKTVGVIDEYNSIIWANRFSNVGDFEIYTPVSQHALNLLRQEYFVTRTDDEMVAIIEKIDIKTSEESGSFLTVSGRCAKSILARRIVWKQTILKGTVEECLRKLVTENVISPEIPERKIPNFFLADAHGFTEKMEAQVTGGNLLDVISKICNTYDYGFKVFLNDYGQFLFDVVKGEDRSYNQTKNPYVVFSPNFDNLLGTDYQNDLSSLKNVALVAGEGEGLDRKNVVVGFAEGMNRRELYVDAKDLTTNNGEITASEYDTILSERGNEKLSETVITEAFSGEIEPKINYRYKTDFYLGDIVQIENEYGMTASPRIYEIIENEDETGYKLIPKFTQQEV